MNEFENTETIVEVTETPKITRKQLFWDILKTRIWDILGLNLIYMILCIPIVTIGPATCGIVKVLNYYANDRPVSMMKDFFSGFTKNFLKGLGVAAPTVIYLAGCTTAAYFYGAIARELGGGWYILLGIVVIIAILIIMMNLYAYIMIVSTDLSFKNIVKNSLLFAIISLKTNIPLMLMSGALLAACLLLSYYAKYMLFLVFFFPITFNWFVICFNCYPIIYKYVIEPYYKEVS